MIYLSACTVRLHNACNRTYFTLATFLPAVLSAGPMGVMLFVDSTVSNSPSSCTVVVVVTVAAVVVLVSSGPILGHSMLHMAIFTSVLIILTSSRICESSGPR